MNMNFKILITLPLLLFCQLLMAEITVKVDRDPVLVDESFNIVFESDQNIDAEPDFSPLNKSFTILNRSNRTSSKYINGKSSYSQMWILSVISNKSGTLDIPSIRFGNESTKPLSVNVVASATATNNKTKDDIFIEIDINTKQPYVQAQVIYTVKLYRAVVTNNASLSEPELTGGQAIVNKLGEDSSFETQRNGKRYVVIQRQYVIFPQSSGNLKIEPLIFQGQTGGAGSFFSFDPFGPQPKSIVKRSERVELDVQPIPDFFTGDTWLPANQLTIQEQWSVDPSSLKQGEATTRTLTLTANGLAASNLPAIKSHLPAELKQYPDQPEFEEKNNANGYIGIRRDKMAIIPTEGGDYTLPAIKIPWWNTDTDQMEIAELPERLIHAKDDAAIQTVKKQAVAADEIPSNTSENKEQSGITTIDSMAEAPIWKWASLLLLVLWLVTLFILWRIKRVSVVENNKPDKKPSIQRHIKKIQQTCKSNDPESTKQALLEWANSLWSEKRINNINAIKEYCDEDFKNKIDYLNNCLYVKKSSEWDGIVFLKSFESQSFEKKKSTAAPGKLEPLYKT